MTPTSAFSLYEELKSWQGGISSLFGFLALIVGALWNFRLNRRRDAALRSEEMVSVAAALYGEILLLRVEAAALARAVANVHISVGTERDPAVRFNAHFVAAHQISEAMLYKALAPKLGLLPAELIIGITAFHKDLQEMKHWLPLLIDAPDRTYSYGAAHVLMPARDAVFDIVPALKQIERMANIQTSAEPLDLGHANSVIADEEEFRDSLESR
jgi:hypothetical protein